MRGLVFVKILILLEIRLSIAYFCGVSLGIFVVVCSAAPYWDFAVNFNGLRSQTTPWVTGWPTSWTTSTSTTMP